MELKQYFNIILKRVWILILIPVVTGGASAYVSLFVLNPVYESNTTLYVINKSQDPRSPIAYNDIMAGQSLVKDYRELIKSRLVTAKVIEDLKLNNMTSGALANKISVNSKNDTRLIEIKVQDVNPQRAKEIADRLAAVFVDKVIELMKVETVGIVDTATVQDAPVAPKPAVNIVIAVFAGIMASIGIILLLEYLDDTVKTSEDVEKQLGLTVLGAIPMLEIK